MLISSFFSHLNAQKDTVASYTKKTYMVPMRDGVKLFTVVLSPTNSNILVLSWYNEPHMVQIFRCLKILLCRSTGWVL